MPASTIRTSTSGSREAGPMVATILVRRIAGARYTARLVDNVTAMSIETEDELEGLRRAGHVVAVALRELRRRVQPGVTTAELDAVAGRVFARFGARSAPKLVYGAPCEVFISVNDHAVHGVPGRRRLRRGDLVSLDVTAELDGFFADACVSVPVGPAAPRVRRLVSAADAALARGLAAAVAGAPVRAVSAAVAGEAEARGVAVLEDLGGHGIGRTIHEPPSIPNAPDPDDATQLHDGLVITVEPILGAGGPAVRAGEDGWTIRTADGSWAAHAEHTIVVTAGRPLVLTA
jgi:methionyl aminopeptidase